MKIFHMGDWPIGKSVNGFYMAEDQEFIMEQLYEEIQKEKPDVLLKAWQEQMVGVLVNL